MNDREFRNFPELLLSYYRKEYSSMIFSYDEKSVCWLMGMFFHYWNLQACSIRQPYNRMTHEKEEEHVCRYSEDFY